MKKITIFLILNICFSTVFPSNKVDKTFELSKKPPIYINEPLHESEWI